MTETASVAAVEAPSRARSIGVYALVAVAGILLFLTTFAVWVDRVALNTAVFADTSSELIEDDAIRRAVATRAVDELFESVDVEAELKGPLPEDVESLAGPTSAALQQVAPGIVERALQQPRLQRLWRRSVEASHATLVEVLEERSGTVSTEEGTVTLDLGDIVREAADRIGVSDAVEERIDDDAGRIELLQSDDLDTAQDAFQLLNALAWLLPLLTIGAFALALWLAGVRRRPTVRAIGVAILVSGLVGLVAVRVSGWYLVGELTADSESQEAGGKSWAILTELLRGSFRLQIVLGLLFLLAAWVAGAGPRAVGIRRGLAPYLRQRRYAYGVLGVVALVVLLTGQVGDFARLVGEFVVIGLLAGWIEWLRRQTLREFPDAAARPPAFDDARARLSEWYRGRQTAVAGRGSGSGSGRRVDLATGLKELADLHASGELTDAEYAAAKARIIAGA